jgi:hypothetical protein
LGGFGFGLCPDALDIMSLEATCIA